MGEPVGLVVELRRQPARRRGRRGRAAHHRRGEAGRERARRRRRCSRELEAFVDRYPFVGYVDGLGLFLRIELVRDKKTKEPLPRQVTARIFTEACAAAC